MRVAVLCEFSGIVRDSFISKGHDAISFDLLPSEKEGPHIQGDLYDHSPKYYSSFDLVIAHPPCTHLATSGARWFKGKEREQEEALKFVKWIMDLPVEKIALENPISVISSKIRQPDQIIQPWQFGHPEKKATCLWLKNLPPLIPTDVIEERSDRIKNMPQTKDRWKNRSRTFQGIAEAMADQWGK